MSEFFSLALQQLGYEVVDSSLSDLDLDDSEDLVSALVGHELVGVNHFLGDMPLWEEHIEHLSVNFIPGVNSR